MKMDKIGLKLVKNMCRFEKKKMWFTIMYFMDYSPFFKQNQTYQSSKYYTVLSKFFYFLSIYPGTLNYTDYIQVDRPLFLLFRKVLYRAFYTIVSIKKLFPLFEFLKRTEIYQFECGEYSARTWAKRIGNQNS